MPQIPFTGLFAGLTLGLLSLDIVGLKVERGIGLHRVFAFSVMFSLPTFRASSWA